MTAASAAARRGDEPPMTSDGDGHRAGGRRPRVGHVPVMVGQVVRGLRPRPGARLVDATVGLGGHAAALLDAAPDGAALGLDRDRDRARARARDDSHRFGDRVRLRAGSFADLGEALAAEGWDGADAILLDLGVELAPARHRGARLQLPARGPARHADGSGTPSSPRRPSSTRWDEHALARAIAELGEEPRARAVARAIVRGAAARRPTAQLARRGRARRRQRTARACIRRRGRSRRSASSSTTSWGRSTAFLADGWTAPAARGPPRGPRLPLARGPAREGRVPPLGGVVPLPAGPAAVRLRLDGQGAACSRRGRSGRRRTEIAAQSRARAARACASSSACAARRRPRAIGARARPHRASRRPRASLSVRRPLVTPDGRSAATRARDAQPDLAPDRGPRRRAGAALPRAGLAPPPGGRRRLSALGRAQDAGAARSRAPPARAPSSPRCRTRRRSPTRRARRLGLVEPQKGQVIELR